MQLYVGITTNPTGSGRYMLGSLPGKAPVLQTRLRPPTNDGVSETDVLQFGMVEKKMPRQVSRLGSLGSLTIGRGDGSNAYWSSYGATGTGTGIDLILWNQNTGSTMSFSTASPAFYGEAIFDLSGYSSYTSLFPALNSTGTIRIWNNDGGSGIDATIGSWKVTGVSAIPEPSTCALLAGLGTLGVVVFRRRQRFA